MVCLIVALQQIDSMHQEILIGQSTGSSMLSDSAGAYVLIAAIAFIAGAIIAALVVKYRKRNLPEDSDKPIQSEGK